MLRHVPYMAVPIASLFFVDAAGADSFERGDFGGHMWSGSLGHAVVGSAMMVVFWGATIVFVVFAVRWFSSASSKGRHEDALEVLRTRFARGEIDGVEFDERRQRLKDR